MKCQSLFSGKNQKNIGLFSEFALGVVKVNQQFLQSVFFFKSYLHSWKYTLFSPAFRISSGIESALLRTCFICCLRLSTLGKIFSRQHFEIFFCKDLTFHANGLQ